MEKSEIESASPSKSTTTSSSTYQLECFRYVNILLFVLSDMAYSITIKTFAPIAADLQQIYAVDPFLVNMAAGVMLLLIPVMALPANYLIDKVGPGVSIKLGSALTILGVWLRLALGTSSRDSFHLVLVGQFVAGLGGPFIYNARCALGAAWFQPKTLPAVT